MAQPETKKLNGVDLTEDTARSKLKFLFRPFYIFLEHHVFLYNNSYLFWFRALLYLSRTSIAT